MTRLLAVLSALVLVLAGAARADDASRLAVAREVVQLSGAEQQVHRMIDVMEPVFVNSIRSTYPQDQAQRLGRLFVEELNAEIPALLEDAAAAYAQALSEEDLIAMREFYRSPAGQHMVQSLPVVSAALQRAGGAAGQAAGQRAVQRLQDDCSRTRAGAHNKKERLRRAALRCAEIDLPQ